LIDIYTDGACIGNPGPGGWAALVIEGGRSLELKGHVDNTTNNQMEILAAIKGLEQTPPGSAVTVHSDSQYLVYTMSRGWKREMNLELWEALDKLVSVRRVSWVWVRGHAGHKENTRANLLARQMAEKGEKSLAPSHFDSEGKVRMVDVSEKKATERIAIARGTVVMKPATLELIKKGETAKGDVLAVAQMAGIMAAKQTHHLIPLCHPLPITNVTVEFKLDADNSSVDITTTVKTTAQTGVEMEALTAVAVAALTIYDMCKAVDRGMRIENIRLARKSGGRSGDIVLE